MTKTINFLDKTYTQEGLRDWTDEDLLELRNLVASNLGVANVRGFKDHDAAVAGTWKALEKYEETSAAEEDQPQDQAESKPAKPPKEPKDRKLAKSAQAKTVKRPTRKMFSTIKKVKEHPGTGMRFHRWPNYKDGMTIVDIIETEGTEPWDVYHWEENGLIKITEPTDEEYEKRRKAWYEAKGQEDPEAVKARKEKEKAEREAAKAAEAQKDETQNAETAGGE